MAGDLQDRVAIITAAGSGMGLEAAKLFGAEGAHVVAADINGDAVGAVVDEIGSDGGSAEAQIVDMTDLAQVEALATGVGDRHGHIDVLWNHAGVEGPRGFEFDADVWEFQVNLNLRSSIFMTKFALPYMGKGRPGSILFTESISAVIASRNSPVYATLKAGLGGYMRCIAAIGGPDNIRANSILPGGTETPMLAKFFAAPGESEEVLADRLKAFTAAIPMGRYCKPEEVAQLGLFLASDKSSFITGVEIPIDGGYVAL